MVALTKDNAFLNAEVMLGNSKFFVVKINDKSVYLAKNKDALYDWESRPKGLIWKDFCKRYDVIMTKYDGLTISALEISRGKTLAQVESKKSKRRYLSNTLEMEVRNLYKRFKSKKGSWSHPIEDGKGKQAVIVSFSNNGQALVRCDMDFFFYDLETNDYTYYKRVGDAPCAKGLVFPREDIVQKI
jgi:hypothetical protein